jgi:hypothetical protein
MTPIVSKWLDFFSGYSFMYLKLIFKVLEVYSIEYSGEKIMNYLMIGILKWVKIIKKLLKIRNKEILS